ncbi:MAG: HU family DNA-binding protein [Phocaeicola sp.]
MNQKVTTNEIAEAIALKHGMDKKEAELFIKGMFELIEEALTTEKYVKIKGLGTFKLTEVDSRGSVDVNTGERIEIQGHTKISFLPDTALKEIINRPFSHFENVLLNESASIESGSVEEKPSTLENGSTHEESTTQSAITQELNVVEEKTVTETTDLPEELSVAKTEAISRVVESSIADEAKTVEITHSTQIEAEIQTEVTPTPPANRDEKSIQEKEEEVLPVAVTIAEAAMQQAATKEAIESTPVGTDQNSRIEEKGEEGYQPQEREVDSTPLPPQKEKSWAIWAVAILLLVLLGCAFYYYHSKGQTPEKQQLASNSELTIVQEVIEVVDSLETDTLTASTNEPELVEIEESTPPTNRKLSAEVKYEIVGTQTTDTIGRGESLSQLAVKYYGETKLWTYLVKHNSHIKNPDNVPFGTVIKIPELRPLSN